ncbi:hypothetical protein [Methanosarcina sp.]|uniref:hypothetical protein n=1 Tax=Methanosarcina sp. TaxID=2213 RepID=UPI003BB51F6D
MAKEETTTETTIEQAVETISTDLVDETAGYLTEIEQLREEIAELEATLRETRVWNTELQSKLAAATTEVEEYKKTIQSDTSNQSVILNKIEKLASSINDSESNIESGLTGLSDSEVAVLKVHRQDKINELKIEKENLRNLLSRSEK